MPGRVDLYNNAYAKLEHDLYRLIRTDTYGQDLGQTSWVSTDESNRIPELLNLNRESLVLDIGCGSGAYAIYVAHRVGCRVIGLDVNPHAIASATQLAAGSALNGLARFEQCDASQSLPFTDGAVDAAFANDSLCHIPERAGLLRELFRVLRPGGRLLFSDALVIGGVISQAELATRSSIGPYFFSPPGENERLLAAARFAVLSVIDTSEQAAGISGRWCAARERRREQLIALEGVDGYDGVQRFLACVRLLTSERRLLRYLYLAERPGSDSAV
jgi:SAM-dependent methyltransferase